MGLAASQVRLLMLTARKDDVEFGMQAIANNKLSISRQQADLSKTYSNALNGITLNFDTNGDGTGEDLTYDTLMGPSASDDGEQYIFTNASTGAVILDNDYLSTLGIPGKTSGGVGELGVTDAYDFADKMLKVASGTSKATGATGGTAGTGGTGSGGSTTVTPFTFSYDNFDVIKAAKLNTEYNASTDVGHSKDLYKSDEHSTNKNNGGPAERDSRADLSANQVSIVDAFESELDKVSESLGNALTNTAKTKLGSSYTSCVKNALDFAYTATYNKFVYDVNDADATDNDDGLSSNNLVAINDVGVGNSGNTTSPGVNVRPPGSNSICSMIYEYHGPGWGNMFNGDDVRAGAIAYIDMKQLIDTFLGYFDLYMVQNYAPESVKDGYHSTVGNDNTVRGAKGGAEGAAPSNDPAPPANNGGNGGGSGVVTKQQVNFYINIYKEIANNGWQVGGNNNEGLQNQIINGAVAVKEYQTNGFVTLSASAAGSPISYEDANTTKEEAEYEAEKDRLDYKESVLDVQMNNLDTERSAIVTEMESVQKIIDKNMDNFKIFQN